MPDWEYTQEMIPYQHFEHADRGREKLHALGLEGWELVSVIAYPPDREYSMFYFKRQIEYEDDQLILMQTP